MRRSNVEQVKRVIDGKHKKTQSFFMGSMKSKDERIADIRKDKKEGDVGDEDGIEMTKYGKTFMSTKSKLLQQIREADKMPETCPECGKEMKRQYDERPGKVEGKCGDCVIEEEGKMRIKGTGKAYVENRLRKNALAQIKDNKQLLEENLKNLKNSFQVVGNESGELETGTQSKETVNKQKKMLETQITQLNLLEQQLLKEEKSKGKEV